MQKVYVVMHGEYEDTGVSGVFSTEEKASKFCDIKNQLSEDSMWGPFWYREYEVDKYEYRGDVRIEKYYHVWLDLDNGELQEDEIETALYSEDVIIEVTDYAIEVSSINGFEDARKIALEQYETLKEAKNA